MPEPMELENFKAPAGLRAELANFAARVGLKKSQVSRAAVKTFLASGPSREDVLRADECSTVQLALERERAAARAALDGLK